MSFQRLGMNISPIQLVTYNITCDVKKRRKPAEFGSRIQDGNISSFRDMYLNITSFLGQLRGVYAI